MFSISSNCYIIRDIPSVVQTCTRNLIGELRPKTHIGRSLIQHRVRILQAHIYVSLFGTQLTYLVSAYYTPNDCFTVNDVSLLWTKLVSYTTHCSVFSINRLQYY